MPTNDLHPLACNCTDCDAEAVKPCAYCPAEAGDDCQHEDDGGPFFAVCRKCGAVLDDYAGGT